MDLRKKAELLAALPYTRKVVRGETTTGKPIYVAAIQEMEGCLSQGATPEEALANLKEAQIDFIQSLLEDNLPVPQPNSQSTISTSTSLGFTGNYVAHCPVKLKLVKHTHPADRNIFIQDISIPL